MTNLRNVDLFVVALVYQATKKIEEGLGIVRSMADAMWRK